MLHDVPLERARGHVVVLRHGLVFHPVEVDVQLPRSREAPGRVERTELTEVEVGGEAEARALAVGFGDGKYWTSAGVTAAMDVSWAICGACPRPRASC